MCSRAEVEVWDSVRFLAGGDNLYPSNGLTPGCRLRLSAEARRVRRPQKKSSRTTPSGVGAQQWRRKG